MKIYYSVFYQINVILKILSQMGVFFNDQMGKCDPISSTSTGVKSLYFTGFVII